MRLTAAFAVIALSSAAWADDDRPIPQDPARMEKRARERLEWHRKTLGEAYDRVGKKDPRWDKPAHETLDLAARMFAQEDDSNITTGSLHVPAKQAVDAGCTDPLIAYLYARSLVGEYFPGWPRYNKAMREAADALMASTYSPYRKAVAQKLAIQPIINRTNPTPAQQQELKKKLDGIFDLLEASAKEDPRNFDWENLWYQDLLNVFNLYRKLGEEDKAALQRVDTRMAKIKGIEPLRLTVRGHFLVTWAWEARTAQVAANVTEEQFRTFYARCQEAREALTKAYKLNPEQPQVATNMLMVEKGIGEGNREAMETWFERAVKADPNDKGAYWQKLDWLDPKWYGGPSFEPMVAFGRACAKTGNWHNGITLLVGDAHFRTWQRLPQDQKVAYMHSNAVWLEIKAAYDEYFKHVPDDDVQHSKYAMIAYLGGHYLVAQQQFDAAGDRLTPWPGPPKMPLERLQKARDHTARIIAQHGGQGAAAKKAGAAKP